MFHMHSTATSAHLPLDRTMMYTEFLHSRDGVRDFCHANCGLTVYLNPERGHIIDTSTAAALIKTPLQKRLLANALLLHQLKLLAGSNKDTEKLEYLVTAWF